MARFIGVDLGGTNIKTCVIDEDGQVLAEREIPTHAQRGPEAVIRTMAKVAGATAADAGLKLSKIASIGVGCPGAADTNGNVLYAPNLPRWNSPQPVGDSIGELTGRPVFVENDGNAAAFGEFIFGAGREESTQNLVMLTLGTGVGSGIVLDGRIMRGGMATGAEMGHTIIEPAGRRCGCGQRGCLEQYASASAAAHRAAEWIEAGKPTSMQDTYDAHDQTVTAKDVFDAARDGDDLAVAVVQEYCEYLAISCINLSRLFDPQMIVFAGGVTLAGPWLFDHIRERFLARNWSMTEPKVRIVPAELGNQAGRIGAATVALEAVRRGN